MDRLDLPLEPSARAPRHARAAIREFLTRVDRYDLMDTAVLLVDELVTNAVRHAGGRINVTANYRHPVLRVEIHDPSTQPPVLRQPRALDESGRGLRLVTLLAARWSSEPQADGKTIWFELR